MSVNQAIFFIFEEAILLLLMVIQLYKILGVEFVDKTILFFQFPFGVQNILWLFSTIAFFLIGYVVIAVRDETVSNIHRNFSKVFFGAAKQKVSNLNKEVIIFVFGEIVFATVIAISIFLYLDPEINIVPFPMNIISFAFFLGISLLLFSHTKQFRGLVYGPTPLQKKIHEGKHEVKRFTNPKTGSIRIVPKKNYSKNRFFK
ncbi:MAG: hypothetical protein WC462_03225 [archaeon]